MVTACTNQSEYTRFSELMGNFSTCYRSVKYVLICFFCFHLLRHLLKHAYQSFLLCGRNSVMLQSLKSRFYLWMEPVLRGRIFSSNSFQVLKKARSISQNWRRDESLRPMLWRDTGRQQKVSLFCL